MVILLNIKQAIFVWIIALSLFFSFPAIASCISGTSSNGVCVEQISNNYYRFTINYENYDDSDMAFWITPDGHYDYGHEIERYLEPNTAYNFGMVYVFRKTPIPPSFTMTTYDIPTFTVGASSSGNNSNIGSGKLQVSSSWSGTYNYPVYGILTFTNTTSQTINTGALSLTYENNRGYSYQETNTIIPYNWATHWGSSSTGNLTTLDWNFNNLQPNEQRHIYVAFDVASNAQTNCLFTAELSMNHNTTTTVQLNLKTQRYPWDPNFTRIDAAYGSEYQNYSYCNQYSEVINYTVGFQNKGKGTAKDVVLSIDLAEQGYQMKTLKLQKSSHSASVEQFQYDPEERKLDVYFKNIQLPGLYDSEKNPTFQETIGSISFSLQTKCQIDKSLPAFAEVVFIAEDETPMPSILTNTIVAIVGREDENPYCVPCKPLISALEIATPLNKPYLETIGLAKQDDEIRESTTMHIYPNPCVDYCTIEYSLSGNEPFVSIRLLDITGKQKKELLVNHQISKGNYRLLADMNDLESGMYFVQMQMGTKTISYKLLKW